MGGERAEARVVRHVLDMDDFAGKGGDPRCGQSVGGRRDRGSLRELHPLVGIVDMRRQEQLLAPAQPDHAAGRLAQRDGRTDQCFQDRVEIEGGAADHLQNVGGGGLLSARFAELLRELRNVPFGRNSLPACPRPGQ